MPPERETLIERPLDLLTRFLKANKNPDFPEAIV